MTGFVLQRTTDGKYVTFPGSESSYTAKLELARVFPSRETAEAERCVGDERVVALRDLLGGARTY